MSTNKLGTVAHICNPSYTQSIASRTAQMDKEHKTQLKDN
jgi:hypothetical protein